MKHDLRLAVPAGAAWVGAIALVGALHFALPALVVCWAVAALFVVARRPAVALVTVAIALCATSIALQNVGRFPESLRDAASASRSIAVVGTVTATAIAGADRVEARLDVVDGTPAAAPALVFASIDERLPIGTLISVRGAVEAAEPGDDRSVLLFARAGVEIVAPAPPTLSWAESLRTRLLEVAASLPEPGSGLLPGLAIGDTSAVDERLDAAMKTSSLSHLTAVSGANCAIVVGLVMLAGGAAGLPRGVRIATAVVVLLAFVVLVTPEPSVLRAAVMAGLVLFALARGHPLAGLPILSLAVLGLLVADPWLARDFGFALSVLATVGLLVLAAPLARVLERWLPSWLALVVAVPVSAQLACQPVLLLLEPTLPTYGIVANLLAAPAAPVATIVGLAACVLATLVPPLGALLCAVAWVPAAWIASVAHFFSSAPAARLPWPEGAPGILLLVALTGLAVTSLLTRRRGIALVLVVALVVCAGAMAGIRIAGLAGRPTDWQYAMCDVGQGDALVVRSAGATALIDTGPEPQPLADCLSDLGVTRLDLLVLTHFDLDHVGGASAVVGRADRVLVGPTGGPDDEALVARLASAGADVVQAARGQSELLGELRWRVLWPPAPPTRIEPGNDASVAMVLEGAGECRGGCLSAAMLGDLGEEAQRRLLAGAGVGRVDIVKVAHHGSADQSARLYERLGATVALIGVGADNGYGHPTDELLDLLARAGTEARRSDLDGLVLLAPGSGPGAVVTWTARH